MTPTCGHCKHPFDLEGRLPFSGECGHSMCQDCAYDCAGDCPVCEMQAAFGQPVINYQLIEFMKQFDDMKVDDVDPLRLLSQVDKMKERVKKLEQQANEKDLQISDLTKLLDSAPRLSGFTCSECKYPMKEKLAMLCVSCMTEDVGESDEDGSVVLNDYEKAEQRLICCGCENYGDHAKHLIKPYHMVKVAQNVQRLKEELEKTLDMTLCHSGNNSFSEMLYGRGLSFKKSVLDSCEKMLESPTWEEFEAEEARLKMVVKTMITHHKEVADSVVKYGALIQFAENELKKTAE